MKYAKKINLPINFSDLRISSKSTGQYLTSAVWEGSASTHLYVRKKDQELITNSLPEELKKHLFYIDANRFTLLAPHIHIREQTVINLYFEVNGEVTTFYEGDVIHDERWTTDNGNGYYLIDPELIHPVESFCASAGDIWMLNSAQVHGVSLKDDPRPSIYKYVPVDNNHRVAIQLYFDAPYEQLSQFI